MQVLNLDNNGLGYVYTDAFDCVPSLLSLSLSRNVVGFLPDDVFSAPRVSNLSLLSLSLSRNVVGFLPDNVFSALRNCLVAAQSCRCSVCLCRGTWSDSSQTTSSRLCENCAISAWPVTGSRTCGRGRSPACDVVHTTECLLSPEIVPLEQPAGMRTTPRGDFPQILRIIPYCSPTPELSMGPFRVTQPNPTQYN